ncbi:substrate-binding domain-containing protein, partial [Paractinoplanes toevensis]|uniref:substrate-binding domain-containing protein n=1 Tax=Paractinoplanes toevensis TaxID=571911 RepID=UPI001BB356F5
DDVSIIGFDDVPEAGYFHPALTTIRQEFGDVGRQSLRLLLDQLATGVKSAESALVEPVLIPRDTVAAPERKPS